MTDIPRISWSSTLYFDVILNPVGQLQSLSDKVNLPAAILESLISQTSENLPLPHPLIFRITDPVTGHWTHVGVREFTAEPDRIHLPLAVLTNLHLADKYSEASCFNDVELVSLNIQLVDLPKGKRLKLQPLEASYDSLVKDYKALLEHKLRAQYTSLTEGDTLIIDAGVDIRSSQGKNERRLLKFAVVEVEPHSNDGIGAINIIDTDINLEIVPLSEDKARQSSEQKTLIASQEVPIQDITIDSAITIPVGSGLRKFRFKLEEWINSQPITPYLVCKDDSSNLEADTSQSQLYISIDEMTLADDSFLWSTASGKQLIITPDNPYLNDDRALALFILVKPLSDNGISSAEYELGISQSMTVSTDYVQQSESRDEVECENCHQSVPSRVIQLHSSFCARNNVRCEKGCGRVYLKSDGGIPANHWHCIECSTVDECIYGDTQASYAIHQKFMHQSTSCQCGQSFANFVVAAQHRALECGLSLHICQFCHLSVPRGSQNDDGTATPSTTSAINVMVGFTDHEAECGNRTSDCHICNKAVRLRDMKSHLKWHQIQRLDQHEPTICSNENCVRVLESSTSAPNGNSLGLCGICFGPLYSGVHDPDGIKLNSRLERRYVIQMTRGCGKTWCRNHQACLTASQGLGHPKHTMGTVMGLVTEWISAHRYEFCVDEMTTKRHEIVNWIAQEGVYSEPWISKAVQEAKGNENATRQWLSIYGVKINE
ncbi:hypothetical protein NADFUDRAFT_84195 [Nadsonia fulvescens var. elongata DSM 6958]|uniref:Ubiquitin-protein ligase E3A N-terminal zinc-binding domain-containing protein n=1 Tax=Nadsonia fulvescens var. elongata DSM 6958 TaxID=857566 RepID=A0A1E3PE98_9ASCO|nr:hypothetical protein NADFUDRAFT_84195 [Nadsonia fulvescens var. elongata DSM 6958]